MRKILVCITIAGTFFITSSPVFADTFSASIGTTEPSSSDGLTYDITKNATNLRGTYYFISVDGVGLAAVDPPTVMF